MKTAIITGGGTGIGAAVARQCVAAGARVTLMGRRLAPLQAVADPLGALAVAGDAADTADVRRALAVAREAQDRSGLAIRKIVRQLRTLRSATIAINGTRQTFEPEINDTDRALLDALHGRRSRH